VKKLSILGSTGSIGRNTLEVVSRAPEKFRVTALTAGNNIQLLQSQIERFKPEVAAVYDKSDADILRNRKLPVKILSGEEGLIEAAAHGSADMVVSAISGSAGLMPTLAAVKAGKTIALATKEALVMAGNIIMAEAAKRGVKIIPVDSEHSAVFQCLNGRDIEEVKRLILTASGGAFLGRSAAELEKVTPEDALNHPNWDMGRKITIDSATLMNKGLEVIEAYWLFNIPIAKIDVIIHPQSIIHSMVEFIDGSILAQMSVPDMKGPISFALSYPVRSTSVMPFLNLTDVAKLTFEEPDNKKCPSLSLTYEALRKGGTMPCVLNSSNEAAVEAFLKKRISFTAITRVVSRTMSEHSVLKGETIEEVLSASDWARHKAEEIINELEN